MKKLNEIKELLCDRYIISIERAAPRKDFKAGFDAASTEWQKIVEPLVDAISNINLSHDYDCAIAINGRHDCSCGYLQAKKALIDFKKEIE